MARRERLVTSCENDTIRLHLAGDRPASVALTFEGASSDASLVGEGKRGGHYNFFVGNDPGRWRSNVPTYESVRYRRLYAGVDVRVREAAERLEYDLILGPEADLTQVVVRAGGGDGLELAPDGALILHTTAGPLRQAPPTTWEVLPSGERRFVESRFRRIDAERYGFDVPGRDRRLALVVDPGLEWSTFLGGGDREEIHGLALTTDGSGDVVVAGKTFSADFPATAGNRGTSPLIPFVARLNASGTALVYATLFGGMNGNVAHTTDLALDASSAPIVVGETNAADFPTTPGAYDPTFNEPSAAINRGWDAFVTRFDASGSALVFSTFLGAAPIFDASRAGSKRGGDEGATAVALDASGSVIVAGWTSSEDFPTTAGAYDRTHEALQVQVSVGGNTGIAEARTDAFIARLNPTGTQLTYSTYLGGQSDDRVSDMVVDAQGFVTVTGTEAPIETFDAQNNRTDHGIPFPTTADAVARTHLGASDTFLARLKLDGAGAADLKYATIFGGFYIDEASGIALDPTNPELVTICGDNRSWDFPTTPGAWNRAPIFLTDGSPYYSGFVTRFRFPATGGGSLVWSTLIEGTIGAQIAYDVAVDPSGDVLVVGVDEGGLSTTERSWKRVPPTGVFVSRLSGDGRQLLYSTFLNRTYTLFNDGIRVVSAGPRAVLVAGNTLDPTFPTTPGAFDGVFGSDGTSDFFHRFDGFVAKLTLEPNPTADTTAAAPTLVSPADGASFPLPPQGTEGPPLVLDWTDVADPSGVQGYEVAVGGNPDFAPGFGSAPGAGFFTVSQSVTPSSPFVEGVFYWRVRTLDGVNNFSPWSAVRKFTLGAPTWTNFSAATLTPNGVVGGSTVQGKVLILNAAPPGGQVYTLTSSNTAVATVPATVTVPGGANSATFAVTTKSVAASTPVQITVWSEGNGDHPVLWVDPAPAGAVTLASLTVSPATVPGGSSSTGTATLSGAAPAGGAVVSLSSSDPAATVPGSVLVPFGATSATFSVGTTAVTVNRSINISGTLVTTRSAVLTVTAPAPPAPPAAPTLLSPANDARVPQPVTFDWTDVSGAASYTIQIDDASSFSAPLLVQQTVTASQFTTGALPGSNLRRWWRVRANGPTGLASGWSAVRQLRTTTGPVATTTTTSTLPPPTTTTSPPTTTTTAPPPTTTTVLTATTTTATTTTVAPDTVAIQQAEYDAAGRRLRVEATSTSSTATLTVSVTSTGAVIGTLTNDGGGRYRGEFSWPTNPQNITVRSSRGGAASRTVTVK